MLHIENNSFNLFNIRDLGQVHRLCRLSGIVWKNKYQRRFLTKGRTLPIFLKILQQLSLAIKNLPRT